MEEEFAYTTKISTDAFVEFIQNYTGKDLKDFFQLYLYSTNLPEVHLKKKGKNQYQLSLEGIQFELPIEVKTSTGIQKYYLGKTPTLISSTSTPEVDPRGWLMLKR